MSFVNRGRKRNYNTITDEKIAKMMEVTYQQRTEAKIKWAVKLYRDWRQMRLDRVDYDDRIYDADIDGDCLTKVNLEYALCRFICEVKKSKDQGDFPGRTLYQIVCCLQNHLRKREISWKLVHGEEFSNFQRVLDKVMQERSEQNIGTIRKQAQVISLRYEDELWQKNILGEDNPEKLHNTVLYILGVNLALRAGDEHYALRRSGCGIQSQLSFESNEMGLRCLVYREDTITKTNRGGLRDMKKERKIVWIKPSSNWVRCPVRIVEKYMNLLPVEGKKRNLYLQTLKVPRPNCWYSSTPLGINKVRAVVGSILKKSGLDGFFTNHSLRRTCATRLFQAGQSVKIVKEITGHVSDAVHKYQTTSDEQRMAVSKIIQGDVCEKKLSEAPEMEVVEQPKELSNDEKFKLKPLKLPVIVHNPQAESDVTEKSNEDVGSIIQKAIKAVGARKAKLKIEVELLD